MRKNKKNPYGGLINPSWIRRYFMRQDDFILWTFGVILVVVQIRAAVWLITLILKGLAAA